MQIPEKPFLSVVTSLYRSGEYIEEFYTRSRDALDSVTDRWEIVFVNDGSPDDSLQRAVRLKEQDPRVVVVDLSRNFGQHKAQTTGLDHTSGELVFLLEADLEESPEWVVDFLGKLREEEGVDVVFGVQKTRKGGFFERVTGEIFYRLFNLIADVPLPRNPITTRLMTRRYVDALTKFRDKELFLGGIYELVGFEQRPFEVEKLDHSETTYTLYRKILLLINAVTSFSTVPLQLIFWAGLAVFLVSSCVILYVIAVWSLRSIRPGWSSIIASIWAVGGLLMLSLGVIGIYLKKTLEEVKQRPYSVVRAVHRSPEHPASTPSLKLAPDLPSSKQVG